MQRSYRQRACQRTCGRKSRRKSRSYPGNATERHISRIDFESSQHDNRADTGVPEVTGPYLIHRPNALQLVDRPILPFNVQVGGRVGRHSGRPAHSRRKTTITISASHLKDTTHKFSTIVALRGRQSGKCFRNQSRSAITAIQLRFAPEIPNRKPGPKARTATSIRRTNQRTESLSGIPDNNPNQKIALNPKPANNSDSIQSQSTRQAT